MKIKEIIHLVNKDDKFKDSVCISQIAEEMGFDTYNIDYQKEQDKITSYYIGDWYCTDSRVGYKVYFFDNKPVAVSSQTGRKMDEEIEWLSKEDYYKVREYVVTFITTPEANIALADVDEELGDSYKIHYHCQLFSHHPNPLLDGQPVEIIEKHKGEHINEKKEYEPSLVKIKLQDSSTKWIEMKYLSFPFYKKTE